MATNVDVPDFLASNGRSPAGRLLLIADQALARAFRRELRSCVDCKVALDTHTSFEEAQQTGAGPYQWVAVDLDGAIAPSEAVSLARHVWPNARVAVLSLCWSERNSTARDLADVVIHKPLRSVELRAFLRVASAAETTAASAEPVPLRSSG